MNETYHSFSGFLSKKFPGEKIVKIPIAAGLSCPNRDGSLSWAGCTFCDSFASGPLHAAGMSIEQQIEGYMASHPGRKYIAYFQAQSNTYGPVSELRRKFETVFKYADIVGLFIGTRPDAISEPAFLLLAELNRKLYLAVELGLQSIHSRSLLILNRNHTYAQFLETYQRLQAVKIDTVVHLIVGIPGETRAHMLATIDEMNRLKPVGIKFHLLHVLRGTALHRQYLEKPFPLLSRDDYAERIAFLLEYLDPDIVIHRLTAERDKEIFVAPEWALNKQAVLAAIQARMKQTGAFQGRFYVPAPESSSAPAPPCR
jgi:radical SAM protein (TIGR01212 family)